MLCFGVNKYHNVLKYKAYLIRPPIPHRNQIQAPIL